MASPPRKKSKYDSEPGVWSGAKSASDLAKETDSDAAFVIKPVDLESFFPVPTRKSDSETPKEAIVRRANEDVMDLSKGSMATLRIAINENAYRNGIYRQLTGKKLNLEVAPGTGKWLSYEEKDLVALFRAFVEVHASNIPCEEKDELFELLLQKEHGLKITTTSKPDLSILRRVNGEGEFILGEVKHASNYTQENAQQQVACYLQCLLYFLRVKLGLPITTVCGFALCGTKCSGIGSTLIHPKYAVGFVKIIAPEKLGGKFKVECWWGQYGAFDSSGLKLLIHFLNVETPTNIKYKIAEMFGN